MQVALLLSGGVDSSVALKLLLAEGHDVTAFYLKIWLQDELAHLGDCPWEDDLAYARAVCDEAGVDLRVVSLQREYHELVVSWTVAELRAGRTPSPDVLCNRRIKFGAFLESDTVGSFDRVASGHYARLNRCDDGTVHLLKGKDPVKDQTYFLFKLDQAQLRRSIFPLGGYQKNEVRQLAEAFSLPNRQRKDSQGICFLGKIPYPEFVRSILGESPGEIREIESGRRLGEHRGNWFHTIGQRRGLGLGAGPWYVVGKDVAENIVYVSHSDDLSQHRRDRFRLDTVHWNAHPPSRSDLRVKLRHSPQTIGCTLKTHPEGSLDVYLDTPDPGIANGQMAVLYEGDRCLGGGMISIEDPAPLESLA